MHLTLKYGQSTQTAELDDTRQGRGHQDQRKARERGGCVAGALPGVRDDPEERDQDQHEQERRPERHQRTADAGQS